MTHEGVLILNITQKVSAAGSGFIAVKRKVKVMLNLSLLVHSQPELEMRSLLTLTSQMKNNNIFSLCRLSYWEYIYSCDSSIYCLYCLLYLRVIYN